jgi:hypothetical protein
LQLLLLGDTVVILLEFLTYLKELLYIYIPAAKEDQRPSRQEQIRQQQLMQEGGMGEDLQKSFMILQE